MILLSNNTKTLNLQNNSLLILNLNFDNDVTILSAKNKN